MRFDPIFPISVIILLLLPLTIFLLLQELKKTQRLRNLRVASVLIMIFALAGMMIQPKISRKKLSKVILLTQGYSEDKVDSIVRRDPQWSVWHLPQARPFKDSKLMEAPDLPYHSPEIAIVAGEGIPRHLLDRMEDERYILLPSDKPEGITDLYIPPRNFVNRKSTISGTYNNLQRAVRLYLNGPGTTEDSVVIQKKGETKFQLSFNPKQSGQFTYTLTVRDSTNTLQENLPLYIEEQRVLNIVFLLSHPTFEAQFLKNFLAKENNEIIFRSQVSANKFRYEYLNHQPVSFGKLKKELLDSTHLLVADAKTLATLSPGDRKVLQEAIRSGLGLLNLSVSHNKNLKEFFPFEMVSVKTDTASLNVASRTFSLPAGRSRVVKELGVIPIIQNKSGILAGYTFRGAGKIGFQFAQETYRLVLGGDSLTYAHVWTPLLERLARREESNSKIKIETSFPRYIDEPIDINVISSRESLVLKDDSIKIPLQEDITLDNIWYARTWGRQSGWHILATDDGAKLHHYTFDPTAWKSLSIAKQIELNSLKGQRSSTAPKEFPLWQDFPSIIFFLAFLFAAGFIWLAPKL